MISKKLVWAGIVCLFHTSYLSAQTSVYSLEEIWQKTLDQHPTLASQQALLERQEHQKTLIRQQSYPEINVQAQQSFGSYQNMPGSFFPLPGLYNNSGSVKAGGDEHSGSNVYASAVLQWDFIQFGRLQKKLQVADAAIAVGRAALSQEQYKLQAAGTRYYFDVLHHSARLSVLRSDAARLASLLDLIKSQAEAGLRPGADTLLIKSAFLQAKNKITDQQNGLQASLLQLASLVGEEGSAVAVDTSVYYRVHPGEALRNSSIARHPYLQYLDAAIDLSKAEVEAISKEPYPSVGLLAGAGIKGSGIDPSGTVDKSFAAPWSNNSGSYLVGVGVTWKLSSLYQNKTKKRMAERQVASARAGREAARLQLQAVYTSALAAYKEQAAKVRDARLALEEAQAAYELYSVRYESGLIDLIELLQLQKDLQGAESNYVAAIHSYWSELLVQSEALGQPSIILTAIQP